MAPKSCKNEDPFLEPFFTNLSSMGTGSAVNCESLSNMWKKFSQTHISMCIYVDMFMCIYIYVVTVYVYIERESERYI